MKAIQALGLKNIVENTDTLKSTTDKKYILSGSWTSKNVKFGDKAKFRITLSDKARLNGWVIVTLMRVREYYFDESLHVEEIKITDRTMDIDFIMTESLIDYLTLEDIRENKGLKFYCKVEYLDESTAFEEKTPLEIKFIPDYCSGATELPTEDNFPYKNKVFEKISEISKLIKYFSQRYDVPEVAVAGSIADEYNTTQTFFRGKLDSAQDWAVDLYSDFYIEITKNIISDNETITKLRNPTMNDLGIGNIKLDNAKKIYDLMPTEFDKVNWDYTDLVDYIHTNTGSVHFAALTIKIAKALFEKYISNYSDCAKEAVLVTFYKQGPNYFNRFFKKLKENPNYNVQAGEGNRVAMQRNRILKALNTIPK